ncbi:MAG: extracellular solute-binding protein [Actinobacteria bacterium]|nr:extracellular solute-binding protein [Actinomycetota bacterium]MBU1610158.1 extracellular solute-binding protein [Actinomycetota bacterium]MBU2316007.1 extracellular solute-binding protein [Actinomycetota bacterium]MBU2383923.1 extracellular solute-binding protein [Actinomycetota bacterium]
MLKKRTWIGSAAGLALLAVPLTACSETTASNNDSEALGPLVIATWGGATSEATRVLAEQFTADTGIQVEVLETGNHLSMIRSMDDANNTEWDILDGAVLGDAYQLYVDGLLEPWDAETAALLGESYGEAQVDEYSYPWIGYGQIVVCNADAVEECPTNVVELLDTEAFPGNRMLPGDPGFFNTMLPPLAIATGSEPDDLFEPSEGVDRIADKLREVAPSTTVWFTSGDAQNQAMLQGEADMGLMASGRAYTVQDEGVNLELHWDGTYIYGATSILKNAPNKEAAVAYIRWLAENPAAQATWAETLNYAVPHLEAINLIDPEIAERLATYPANFSGLALQDVAWQSANKAEIDETFLNIIVGE